MEHADDTKVQFRSLSRQYNDLEVRYQDTSRKLFDLERQQTEFDVFLKEKTDL